MDEKRLSFNDANTIRRESCSPSGCFWKVMDRQALFIISLIAVGCGCTAESSHEAVVNNISSGNHRPVILQATVVPNPIQLNGPISVQIHADDQDRDALTFYHQWVVNGQPLAGQTASTLPAKLLKQGDIVGVEIIPDDGKEKGAIYRTAQTRVVNTPPIISSLSLGPDQAKPGDRLEAIADVRDPDNDHFDLSFRWWRNRSVIKEGTEAVLDTTGYSRNDVVSVEVIARDQTTPGNSAKSEPLVLINTPPTITSVPSTPVSRDRYEYAVKAMDPDGDRISFRLETAPTTMTIETDTGYIVWQVTPGLTGTHKIRVVAEDNHGGTTFQEFDITIYDPGSPKSEEA